MTIVTSHRDVPTFDVRLTFPRRTNLSGANLKGANLQGADSTDALLRDSGFEGARLERTILRGADLSGARNLTVKQLALTTIGENTVPPVNVDRQLLAGPNPQNLRNAI